MSNISKDLNELGKEKENLSKDIEEKNTNLEKIKEKILNEINKKDDLEKAINQNKLSCKEEISNYKIQKSLMERNEGYFYSVSDFLKKTKNTEIEKLYINTLANLITVKSGYEEIIENLIGQGLDVYKRQQKTYEDEIDYKNSTNCILYIENVIRKSDKIIDFKNENNFKLLISEGKNKFTYRFEQNGKKLYVYINNLNSSSQREIKIPIGYCSDSKISYDKNDDSFTIDIDFYEKEGNSNYKTYIRRLE